MPFAHRRRRGKLRSPIASNHRAGVQLVIPQICSSADSATPCATQGPLARAEPSGVARLSRPRAPSAPNRSVDRSGLPDSLPEVDFVEPGINYQRLRLGLQVIDFSFRKVSLRHTSELRDLPEGIAVDNMMMHWRSWAGAAISATVTGGSAIIRRTGVGLHHASEKS